MDHCSSWFDLCSKQLFEMLFVTVASVLLSYLLLSDLCEIFGHFYRLYFTGNFNIFCC